MCGEPRAEHVGTTVTLAGWAARRRDLGGLVFVDLRDRTGITQLVINPERAPEAARLADGIRNEFVLQARGDLALRAHDELVANLMGHLGCLRRALRVDHELRQAALVAEVDEDQAPVVAPSRRPAREGEAPADVLLPELARLQVAPPHARSRSASSPVGTSSSSCPGLRTVERSGPHSTIAFAPRRRAWVSWPFIERSA